MFMLDTHAVLWLLGAPEKLSADAADVLQQAETDGRVFCLSSLSLYEIAYGVARNRIIIRTSIEEFLQRIEADLLVLPLTRRVAMVAATLDAPFPGDPFDRIIAATALTEGIPLITADERIRRAGVVQTIW